MQQENYKGALQEICQKHKIKFPDYQSVRDAKTSWWSSTVVVFGQIHQGESSKRKVDAEASAAKVALACREAPTSPLAKRDRHQDICFLVDLENMQLAVDDLIAAGVMMIYAFSSVASSLATKKWPDVKHYVSRSSRQDASDILLLIKLYKFSKTKSHVKLFIIITKDHIGKTIEDVAMLDEKIPVRCYPSVMLALEKLHE